MNPAAPPRSRPLAKFLLYVGLGIVLGFFFHYLLYRIYLPVEPFIYVAF
jgi:hypothetical protein